ncbi:MAG TPA: alpha-2-macroglobulin family protein, partial [Candidatus Hydrogenedentes bacterium]|nr:alpha-2-macroglobulin family protein [Candidatus Hydrogenedentota bacterium]
ESITIDRGKAYASSTFLSRWNRLEFNAPASPSLIRLSVNKDVHTPGDTCELHIQAPYDGVAFVAVQNDRFRDAKVVPVVNGEALLSFVVTRDHFPNAWLEVTVVRKSDPNPVQAHPFSSFAMAELKVSDTANRIEVALPNLPTEVRPAQRVDFTVETKDAKGAPVSSEVTLAAVDEGIHNILEFANPDPFTWFQRPRLPRFNYAHYYDKVAYDFTPASVGGDAILKRLGGAPQIGDNWIKPVALWSGAVRTDANGLATVGFDLPEFNGQLRLVAVAATPGATGSTAGSLFVRRPYILQTSMPRFALPGDTFACGASVINTTQAPCQTVIRWRSEGTLSGAGEKTFALAPGATASDRFEFSATAMGQGRILWEADILPAAGGAPLEHLAQEAPIPVRAPAAWQSEVKQHVVNPGETLTFQNTAMTEDQTVEQRLHVSGNPLSRMTG